MNRDILQYFFTLILQNLTFTCSSSHFGYVAFQVLSSHMRLVAATLDSTGLELTFKVTSFLKSRKHGRNLNRLLQHMGVEGNSACQTGAHLVIHPSCTQHPLCTKCCGLGSAANPLDDLGQVTSLLRASNSLYHL